jgi:hypothetical protein
MPGLAAGAALGPPCPCQNPGLHKGTQDMEAERINLIGAKLADLSARTEALRGYL